MTTINLGRTTGPNSGKSDSREENTIHLGRTIGRNDGQRSYLYHPRSTIYHSGDYPSSHTVHTRVHHSSPESDAAAVLVAVAFIGIFTIALIAAASSTSYTYSGAYSGGWSSTRL